MKKLEFNVEGMHCRSCGMIIEENLKDIGVDKAEVSQEKGRVIVTFDESKVNPAQIRKAIEKDGYKIKK
ncbi:hypothetical protein COV19_00260 [Candidatus Woesearchaeota archaeon CG10_big_fil_rev_8_21_14_0_10_44_13]|nr:MAG: hypothetical protein COV19_00260 [Candidatus Woesearchaeota archaeon CG10_big_fil_rev_8_21_14_0_10_44_13]